MINEFQFQSKSNHVLTDDGKNAMMLTKKNDSSNELSHHQSIAIKF